VRVLHAVSRYVLLSEGFVADLVSQVERHGVESWVLTNRIEHRDTFPTPAEDRIVCWPEPADRDGRQPLGPIALAARRRRALVPYLRQIGPEIVHAQFAWNAVDVLPAAQTLGLPLVTTVHGSDVMRFARLPRLQRANPLWWRHRTKLDGLARGHVPAIAVSQFIADRLRRLGWQGPIDVIPTGVRLEDFPFRPADPGGDAVRLLFVGRMVPLKGADVVLRALARVREANPGVRLTMVGDGPALPAARALAATLGLEDDVTFTGAQPRDRVAALLQASDVLVTASRRMPDGAAEGGSPVVIKEALAVGLPVVVSDSGGSREAVPDAFRHELVLPGDAEALATRIAALIEDRPSWPERSHAGRAFVEERFAWPALAARTAELYQRLASGA
jgi:colanic acid/amylovoran biosynthesis glycosyltransferase